MRVQVAIKRIADNVPMLIDQDFIAEGISDSKTVSLWHTLSVLHWL